MDERVSKFVEVYSSAMNNLSANKIDDAKADYVKLIESYRGMGGLSRTDREIAHEQLLKVYYGLQSPPKAKIPLISIAILVLIVSFLVMLKPSIVGYSLFLDKFSEDVSLSFEKSGVYNVTLKGVPQSLKVSGTLAGDYAKVYVAVGKKLVKVLDTTNSSFVDACSESCSFSGDSNVMKLIVDVKGKLVIDHIEYDAKKMPNRAPVWKGENNFVISPNLIVNLSKYFSDPDGDGIVYLATTTEGMLVEVNDDQLVLTKEKYASGEKGITIIASDLKDVTKQKIKLKLV